VNVWCICWNTPLSSWEQNFHQITNNLLFLKKKLFSEAHIGYIQYLHIYTYRIRLVKKKRKKIHIHFPFESFIIIFCAKRVMGSYIICGIDGMETNGYIIMLYCIHVLNIEEDPSARNLRSCPSYSKESPHFLKRQKKSSRLRWIEFLLSFTIAWQRFRV